MLFANAHRCPSIRMCWYGSRGYLTMGHPLTNSTRAKQTVSDESAWAQSISQTQLKHQQASVRTHHGTVNGSQTSTGSILYGDYNYNFTVTLINTNCIVNIKGSTYPNKPSRKKQGHYRPCQTRGRLTEMGHPVLQY